MDDPVRITAHDPEDELPVCPGCGAQPQRLVNGGLIEGEHIATIHKWDCSWMLDPDSEPYD